MQHFTPFSALIGGAVLGLAASLLLFTHGKIAGISGIYGGVLRKVTDRSFRLWFLAGLILTGTAIKLLWPHAIATHANPNIPIVLAAGLIVGFGTQLGNGCTSGHGVCGISRLSSRSLVATAIFITTGFATVFVRKLIGG